MNETILKAIDKALKEGSEGVLCTVVEEKGSTPRSMGAKMWVAADGSTIGTIGGGIVEHHVIAQAIKLLQGAAQTLLYRESLNADQVGEEGAICGGSLSVFLEVIGQKKEIVIFGAGHVGKALAHVASITGYRVTIWDDRKDFANTENIPWARIVCSPLKDALEKEIPLHTKSYVVVVTRGHALDYEVVQSIEEKDFGYLGVIGSKHKIAEMKKSLLQAGVSQNFLDKIYAPIGLPIKAETPEEIAISILSEIIAVEKGADISALRLPFHPTNKGQETEKSAKSN